MIHTKHEDLDMGFYVYQIKHTHENIPVCKDTFVDHSKILLFLQESCFVLKRW